jgi:hypothetical protein
MMFLPSFCNQMCTYCQYKSILKMREWPPLRAECCEMHGARPCRLWRKSTKNLRKLLILARFACFYGKHTALSPKSYGQM